MLGPVISDFIFRTPDQALALVNDAEYGLSAGVWRENVRLEFARRAKAGTDWTNTWMDGFAEMPSGGYKESRIRP